MNTKLAALLRSRHYETIAITAIAPLNMINGRKCLERDTVQ